MPVHIITDSLSDLPADVADDLGITVVPANVIFGAETLRDGIDISSEEFYRRLPTSNPLPTTSAPSPGALLKALEEAAAATREVLVITVSHRFSASYANAQLALSSLQGQARVEIIDSGVGAGGELLIAVAAAKAARAGATLDELLHLVRRDLKRVEVRFAFDTLEYLKRGGRIGKMQALMGGLLRIHPISKVINGEATPAGAARSRADLINRLVKFVNGFRHIDELAVEHATTPGDVEELIRRISPRFPPERVYRSRVTPVIGAHVGPSVLAVSVLGDRA
jgi:DegV family protein with EDD domain